MIVLKFGWNKFFVEIIFEIKRLSSPNYLIGKT